MAEFSILRLGTASFSETYRSRYQIPEEYLRAREAENLKRFFSGNITCIRNRTLCIVSVVGCLKM
jgi:hypothetical protein